MKTIELSSTNLRQFNLTLNEGKAVIRNQNRINGLIGVRNSRIPEQYQNLLAKASFSGNAVNEIVTWTTDVFENEPVRLSELSGEDRQKYTSILNDAMQIYANAIEDAEESVKKLLYAAITYSDDSTVYCADGRVVITEWGMSPKGNPKVIGMPMSIEDFDPRSKLNLPKSDTPVADQPRQEEPESPLDPPTPPVTPLQPPVMPPYVDPPFKDPNDDPFEKKGEPERVVTPPPAVKKKKKKSFWWWLIPLLILLALLLCFLFAKGCKSTPTIDPVSPEIDSTNIVLSQDSLYYIADNRLLILIDPGKNLDDFAREFYAKYDKDKYSLSNPNKAINRVTLTLPPDEREALKESLPKEFSGYNLEIVYESMGGGKRSATDPAFSDAEKRWYFDECGVFDAWDVTQGSDEIIVAVIDDGFDLNHPELKGKIVKPYNTVNHSTNITHGSGHGTHVAATVLGNADNGDGISGIAPKCKLMPIQAAGASGSFPASAVMDAIIYAVDNGASVINMSLGMSFGPYLQFAPVNIQKQLAQNAMTDVAKIFNRVYEYAKSKNVTIVAAGGNENILIDVDPWKRNDYLIRVSATQPDRYKADFSNFGDKSTVSAPGVRIYNAIPNNNYAFFQGTSMASPIVAGGCALLLSKDRSLSPAQLAQILRETGNPSPSDVGPIVNFARALNAKPGDIPSEDCEEVNRRYNELMEELERLKREHPGCIQAPDTLEIPEDVTIDKIHGKWKSTTSLYNEKNEEVVIYFTFNGTSTGRLDVVEKSGDVYSAPLSISISGDKINIDQTAEASCPSQSKKYNPYRFVLRPDRNRKAAGNAKNKVESSNIFDFNLIKI